MWQQLSRCALQTVLLPPLPYHFGRYQIKKKKGVGSQKKKSCTVTGRSGFSICAPVVTAGRGSMAQILFWCLVGETLVVVVVESAFRDPNFFRPRKVQLILTSHSGPGDSPLPLAAAAVGVYCDGACGTQLVPQQNKTRRSNIERGSTEISSVRHGFSPFRKKD